MAAPDEDIISCNEVGEIIYKDETTVNLCVGYKKAETIFKSDITQNYYIPKTVFNSLAGVDEYYVLSVSENAVVPTTSNANSSFLFNNGFMICENGKKECRLTSPQGYHLITENNNKIFIYCSHNGCAKKEPLLGYFKKGKVSTTDENENYIKCTNNGCTDEPLQTTACTSGKLFKNGNDFKLCINDKVNDGIPVFTLTNNQYLIQAKLLNSTITDEKKYYKVEVDFYSVQRISTSNNG